MDAKETGRVQPVKVMNFPHTFVIILAMIVVALILTWVVPAGMYDFIKTPSGQKVVDPATFRYIKSTGINPVLIPLYIIKSFSKRIDLMMVIFMAGSAFHVVTKTGALQAILAKGAKRFSNRLEVFIPVLTLILASSARRRASIHLFLLLPLWSCSPWRWVLTLSPAKPSWSWAGLSGFRQAHSICLRL